jgi:hypothetical protein
MKKNIIFLLVCLGIVSSASSQALSSDSLALIPIKSLKNALLVKNERDYLNTQLRLSRDTINIQSNIIYNQDLTINNLIDQTSVYKANEQGYKEAILYKDSIVDLKNTQINQLNIKVKSFKTVSMLVCVLSTIAIILL